MTASNTNEIDVETSETQLTISRTFNAPRSQVFRAFTDPDELEQWYAPGEMTPKVHSFDPQPDGSFAISMVGEDGTHDVEGTFVEVVENERLVHTWRGPGGGETTVTITFEDVDDATRVVLTHEGFDDADTVQDHLQGWSGIFENFSTIL